MSRHIPDWLAWLIVRWQYRKFSVVKVSPVMAEFIGARVRFFDPKTKKVYRCLAIRSCTVIAEKTT